jgi:hypothetical protein
MKNFTPAASRLHWRLLLKIIICTLWLLCIVSAAFSHNKRLPVLGQQPAAKQYVVAAILLLTLHL